MQLYDSYILFLLYLMAYSCCFFHPVFGKCVRSIVNSLVKLFHKFCMLFSFFFFFESCGKCLKQVMNLKNITFILLKNQFERQLLFKSSTLIYRYLYNIYKEHNIAVKLYFILKLMKIYYQCKASRTSSANQFFRFPFKPFKTKTCLRN